MTQAIDILLVEDNPGDVRLTEEAFHESALENNLIVATDGVAALEYLRRNCAHAPDLILLDLNLPRMDGREVLCEIKSDPDLRRIPVVVMSTSDSEADIRASYDLHANCYVTKPVDFDAFTEIVRRIECFWLATVKLPGPH